MKELFKKMIDSIHNDIVDSELYDRNSRVLIIDGLNNFIRMWAAMPSTNDNGDHVGGFIGFLKTLGVAIRTIRPTRVIIVFDGVGGSKRRKKIFPDYKANRGGGPPKRKKYNRKEDSLDGEDAEKQMIVQMGRLINYLKSLPVTIAMINNIEADDVIGYVANEWFGEDEDRKLYIMSTDKDFYQLINKNVSIWNPVKKKIIGREIFKEKYGNITPQNFILLKSMTGDTGDNIPSIKGLGEKTIIKNFPILLEDKQVTIDDVVDSVKLLEKPSAAQTKLLNSLDQFDLNYKLIKLDSSYIPAMIRLHIVEIWNSETPKLNRINIIRSLANDRVNSHFNDINKWLNDHFFYLNSFSKP